MDVNSNIVFLRKNLSDPSTLVGVWGILSLYCHILKGMRDSSEDPSTTLQSGIFCFEYLRTHLLQEGLTPFLLGDKGHLGGWHRLWLIWKGLTIHRHLFLTQSISVGAAFRDRGSIQERGIAASKLFGVPFDTAGFYSYDLTLKSNTFHRVLWEDSWTKALTQKHHD